MDEFKKAILEQQDREIFAEIAALDIEERTVQTIQGRITGGSINIDGSSTVRRTCSLTMVSEDTNIKDYHWGIRTKFKLQIGLKNKLTNEYSVKNGYPDLIWFPQGTYVTSGFNTSLTTNNCTISISGKDKMCLLNGELGGQLFASIDFGTEEIENKKMTIINPIEKIYSSDMLTYGFYYVKDNGPTEWRVNSDNLYVFVKDGQGNFYKNGNIYNTTVNDGDKYQCYKLALNPNDFFEESSSGNYFEKYNNYYVLKDINQASENIIFYNLKEYYRLDFEYTKYQIPLRKIITESVHAYAKEPYHNIIINDLDDFGLEQLTYRGDKLLYALRNSGASQFTQLFFENQNEKLKNFINSQGENFKFDLLTELTNLNDATKFIFNNEDYELAPNDATEFYTVAVLQYGDDIGYRLTDLVYPGDLISNIGDSLTTILDKIKNMLGDFEYFYDLDGRFIFQRQQNYVNSSWSQLTDSGDEYFVDVTKEKYAYKFEDSRLISSIQNSPNLTNLRNDFVVWGKRTTPSGAEIPIHARYAIDTKPKAYQTLGGIIYTTENESFALENFGDAPSDCIKVVDWREIIYQMALDFFAAQGCDKNVVHTKILGVSSEDLTDPDHFLYEVGRRNQAFYPSGYTGYEQYYTDLEGFWRELYNPDYVGYTEYTPGEYEITPQSAGEGSSYFMYTKEWKSVEGNLIQEYYLTDDSKRYWNKQVFESPETLNFWFEFLDSGVELEQFSISAVGDRTKVVNEDKATAIIFKEIPGLILFDKYSDLENIKSIIDERSMILRKSGYVFIYLPKGFAQYFNISYRTMSVKNKIDNLLYQHSYCSESITLSTVPIYLLEPNTRIYINNQSVKVEGDYLINRLTIPLNYNGLMSIQANKIPERLY